MDAALTNWINGLSGHWSLMDSLMVFCANWGLPIIIAMTTLFWWSGANRSAARHACLVAAIAFLASLALNQVILLFVHRHRPYEFGVTHLLIWPNPDWSFPSDHATAVTAICVALMLRHIRKPLVFMAIGSFLVCFARIYVGAHYLGDIFGGIVIGAATALCVHRFYRPDFWPFQRLVRFF